MTNALTSSPTRPAIALPASAKKYVRASKAANTLIAYERCWRDFSYYAESRGGPALGATPETVSAYISEMADHGAKVSTIQQRLAAISFRHENAGVEDPTVHPFVRVTMSGIRRSLGTAPNQKAPLRRDDLLVVVSKLGEDLKGLRDRAILLVAYAGAFRESELTALNLDDLSFRESEVLVRIVRSKTDQEGEGRFKRLPKVSDKNAAICPVRALRAWLNASEITDGPLFRKVDRWNKVWDRRLQAPAVAFILKRAVANAGYDPARFGGHSPRSAFATDAAEKGIPLHEIQEVTFHKSGDMVRRYIRTQGISALRVTRKVLED